MTKSISRWLTLGAIVSTLALTACAAASAPSANAAPVPSDTSPVAITLWHAENGNARNLLTTLIADFQKTYPWITVNADAKNNDSDLLKFGIAAMALNQPPEVLIAPPRTLAEFARRGVLMPLDAFLTEEKTGFSDDERADFFPGLIEAGKIAENQSNVYAFPFDAHPIAMYYNADLLKAAKIYAPPKTWDDFSAAARATTRNDTHGWAMLPTPIIYGAMLASRSDTILDDSQTKIQFSDNAGQATIQFIAGLARGGAAYITNQPVDEFVQGKTAFLLGSADDFIAVSDALTLANKNFAWGAALIPQSDPAHPATAVSGSSIGIFRTTNARARAAWLLARWLAAPEQTARWSRATLALPLRVSALTILVKDAAPNPLAPMIKGGFSETVPMIRSLPTVANAAQIDAALVEMWTTVGNGTDPNVALTRATARANRVLGQGH